MVSAGPKLSLTLSQPKGIDSAVLSRSYTPGAPAHPHPRTSRIRALRWIAKSSPTRVFRLWLVRMDTYAFNASAQPGCSHWQVISITPFESLQISLQYVSVVWQRQLSWAHFFNSDMAISSPATSDAEIAPAGTQATRLRLQGQHADRILTRRRGTVFVNTLPRTG
jgi:hypothetical protein